ASGLLQATVACWPCWDRSSRSRLGYARKVAGRDCVKLRGMSAADAAVPRKRSLEPLRALAPFIAPHWRLLAAALAALVVAAAAQLVLPVALRNLIDEGLAVRDAATIDRYFAAFLAAAVAFGAFAALRFYLISRLGERVVA